MDKPMTNDRTAFWARQATAIITRLMRTISQHWLALANLVLALYIGLPLLAPFLTHAGHASWGNAIHTIFHPLCHQLPERSFFLFGPQSIYSRPELVALVGDAVSLRYIGSELVGYKMAVCQRCTAIYGGWLAWGLLFGLVRDQLRALPIRGFLLLLVPMGLDGLVQLVGLWDSTWQSRMITGVLFGLAVVWLAYPYLEAGMRDVYREACQMREDSA